MTATSNTCVGEGVVNPHQTKTKENKKQTKTKQNSSVLVMGLLSLLFCSMGVGVLPAHPPFHCVACSGAGTPLLTRPVQIQIHSLRQDHQHLWGEKGGVTHTQTKKRKALTIAMVSAKESTQTHPHPKQNKNKPPLIILPS